MKDKSKLNVEPPTQRSIKVMDSRAGNRLVTAIEFPSVATKVRPQERIAWRERWKRFLQHGASLVEIDLIRQGQPVMEMDANPLPQQCQAPYRIRVIRECGPQIAEVYLVGLRDRLPVIRIPLRPSDPDISLDLQALIDRTYESGRYGGFTDYRVDPEPPLQSDVAAWADALLREHGRR